MTEYPDKDPFTTADPRAAEREARRREREARRKARSDGARKSLGSRVSDAIGSVTGHTGDHPAVEPPAPGEPAAGSSPEPSAPAPAAPGRPPAKPASPASPPAGSAPGAGQSPSAGQSPPPAAASTPGGESLTEVRRPRGETEDWFADTDAEAWRPDTSEWGAPAGEPAAATGERSAITGERSAVTGERGAVTGERSPVTGERSAVTGERAAVTGEHPPITGESGAIPPVAPPGGGRGRYGRRGHHFGGSGPPRDPRTLWIRRLVAAGVVLVAIGAIVLLAKAALGGGDEPAPVAKGPNTLKTFSVTIPEGLTIEQMADVAKDAKVKGDYVKAAEKAMADFPLRRYDAEGAPSLEGFLFPATYDLEQGASATDLVAKQLEAFQDYFDPIDMKQAEKKNLTPYDVLKIASMVEKEVQVDKERELVSAVIYNRLKAGDTLGIDATLRYELENYDEQLLQSELDAATPYNTRVTPGLPPTPISNPGQASMEAAAHPADTDYYYFVVKPGTCGEHFFTADSAEFDEAAAEYTAALEAEGGSPTEC